MPNQPKRKRKPGRPRLPLSQAKGKIVPVRLDSEDLFLATAAASESKQLLSEWVRDVLRAAAEEQMYQRTLHDAIREVLAECPTQTATTSDLSEEIARRGLYTRKDGAIAKAQQINARVRKHPDLFGFDSTGSVRLLASSVPGEA
jgi:hypothetical protein